MHRSYLFAPGHDAKLLDRVFTAGADAVMLDLEDAVPLGAKSRARRMVAEALAARPAWVRVNALRSEFVDRPVADRARALLGLADRHEPATA